jgi:DNA polymerase
MGRIGRYQAFIEWERTCGLTYVLAPQPQRETTQPQKERSPSRISPLSPEKATSLEELRAALEAFEGSPLKKTAMHLVFGEGNPQAPLMFVGEAPGADEDRLGRPFVGASGQLLDKMLAAIHLDRTQVYITNILPWRPPGNRTPTTEEMALFLPFVRRHIALVSPRLLCLVGGTAVKALLARQEGIMRLRGRWLPYENGIEVLPTYHPAFLLRSPGRKREAWQDFLSLHKKLQEGAACPGL